MILADRPFLLSSGRRYSPGSCTWRTRSCCRSRFSTASAIQPAAWGFLVWINPLLVTLFQLRLTRATASISPAPELVTALLVMGLPYLLLVQFARPRGGHRCRRHLRDRGDAVGANVPGGRRCAGAQRYPGRVHGRLRLAPRDRLRPRTADRVPGPKQLRGRRDLDDVRLPRGGCRGARGLALAGVRGRAEKEAATPWRCKAPSAHHGSRDSSVGLDRRSRREPSAVLEA